MKAQPRGLSLQAVKQLLSRTKDDLSAAGRMDVLSGRLLGRCYIANPLIGSAETSEVFMASLDGFDCVTYIETVLALARASSIDGFIEWLRKIRYEQGDVQWERRNHYMTQWIRNNVREGIIRPVSMPKVPIVSSERVLNVIPGLLAQRIHLRCVPKRAVRRLTEYLQTGDLIFFASTRKNLDIFHAGIIVRAPDRMRMRHASRGQGMVVEQELEEFLEVNRMTGVIVVRPHWLTPHNAQSKDGASRG
jgi:Protein of unknown function (DUF1460)